MFAIAGPREAPEVAAEAGAIAAAQWLRSLATLAVLVLGLLTWGEDGDAHAEGRSSLAAQGVLGFARLAEFGNLSPADMTPPTYHGGSVDLLPGFSAPAWSVFCSVAAWLEN